MSNTADQEQGGGIVPLEGVTAMPGVAGAQTKPGTPRRVTGTIAPEVAGFVAPELVPSTIGDRVSRSPIERQVAGAIYTGQALMDNRGNITRMPYDPQRETLSELSRLDATERTALLQELYQRGLYPRGSKPSATGTGLPDLQAMGELLSTANVYGYEWKTSLNLLRSDFPSVGRGSGGRKTPVDDIRKSVDQQALSALGRKFTDDEISGLIQQIQSREAGGDKTSLSTMAEGAVSGAAQQEQTAYRFSQTVNLFNDMLRGG